MAVLGLSLLLFFLFKVSKNWDCWDAFKKMKYLCICYLEVLIIVVSLIGITFYFSDYPWPILFIFDHIFFISLCIFTNNVTHKKYRITNKLKNIFSKVPTNNINQQ